MCLCGPQIQFSRPLHVSKHLPKVRVEEVKAPVEAAAVVVVAGAAAVVETTAAALVVAAATVDPLALTPRAALKASAAAWPVTFAAAAAPALQASICAVEALHLSFNCWQMKLVMTAMPRADPSAKHVNIGSEGMVLIWRTVEVSLVFRLECGLIPAIPTITASSGVNCAWESSFLNQLTQR